MIYDRLPDQITGPMTTSQAKTLRSLAVEAYQERLSSQTFPALRQPRGSTS